MRIIIIILSLLLSTNFIAQDTLSLKDAKVITLENNFGIQIAKNNLEIAKNLTDKKANGYLPSVSANGGLSGNFGGSSQQFNNGNEASTSNALTLGANASVRADYAIIDKRRSITLEQLKKSLLLSDLQLKQTIEQNLLVVYNIYFQIAQLAENVEAFRKTLEISNERLRRTEYQVQLGQESRLAILNARVDMQRDSINLINALMNLETEKRNLNISMGRVPTTDFVTSFNKDLSESLNVNSILEIAHSDNITLLVNRLNLNVSEVDLELIEAEKKPTVNINASYNYNYSDNPSGAFITSSNSRGLSANIGLSWTLFDASRNIRKQNTKLLINNQQLQLKQLQQELERDVLNQWSAYQNALYVLSVEQNAVKTNEENFAKTKEQLQYGQISSIEFRQAQLNLLTSQTSLNNAIFNAHLREIQLLQLGGQLID